MTGSRAATNAAAAPPLRGRGRFSLRAVYGIEARQHPHVGTRLTDITGETVRESTLTAGQGP
ncbi:hypothetical protein GCM10010176_043420 [Nonomuraea spiralis]|nr:hypothetical protein GCM10010176_043420 [Nonomuraea spiralis]